MFKSKRTAKRILVTVLLALVISVNAPTVVSFFTDASSHSHEFEALAKEIDSDCDGIKDQTVSDDTPDPVCPKKKPVTAAEVSDLDKKISFIQQIQTFLNLLMWPLLVLTGGLMDSGLLFGGGMEDLLREIWIPIRNVVNLLFVIVLVGIALYNVLGLGEAESEYSIKKILPSLMIGIIAVNFSFTGMKILLDTVNVLTVSIFSIPGSIQEELADVIDGEKSTHDKEVIEKFCLGIQGQTDAYDEEGKLSKTPKQLKEDTINAVGRTVAGSSKWKSRVPFKTDAKWEDIKKTAEANLNEANYKDFEEDYKKAFEGYICHGVELSNTGKAFLKKWNSRNGALALALNMTNIVFYQEIPLNSQNLEKLFVNTIFSLLLYIVYAASFVALFIVLLARLVVLWLAIAISPVLLLIVAVPKIKEKMGDFGTLTDKLVSNAIAPILIALAMTVGWIMLRGIQSMTSLNTGGVVGLQATQGTPLMGLTTLQDLMVALGTVAVVWLGVFSAASQTIAAPVTDAIKGGLTKTASWLGQLPLKHAPIFPIKIPGEDGKVHKATFSQLQQTVTDMTTESSAERNALSNLINPNKDTGASYLSRINTADEMKQWLNTNSNMTPTKMHEALADMKANHKDKYDKVIRGLDGTLRTNVKKLTDKPDRTAHKEIIEDPKVKGAATLPGASSKPKPPASTDPGTAAAPAAAPADTAKVGGKEFKSLSKAQKAQVTTAHTSITGESIKDAEKMDKGKIEGGMKALGDKGAKPEEIEGIIGKAAWDNLKEAFPDLQDNEKVEQVLKGTLKLPDPKPKTP